MPKKHISLLSRIFVALFMGLGLMAWSFDARADFWSWVTDLVTEPSDHELEASLGRMALPPDAIVTGPGEVKTIELGRDILELYPSTAVTIETTVDNVTTVQVITGTVRAKVAKRKTQSFKVETLMLVGTVKGTVFEVSTTDTASAVSVYEGRVAVKSRRGVGGVDVTPGKTATVTRDDRDPTVGKTPSGGASTAAKAKSHNVASSSTENSDDEPTDNKGNDRSRDANTSGRASSSGNSGGGSGSGGGTGSQGGSGSGGEGGESGEGGDGEGGDGEGGEGGDDD